MTHQQHQREHFRLSHPTPVAAQRGHDAVATSGYAGAMGLLRGLGFGARVDGKCSFDDDKVGGRYTCHKPDLTLKIPVILLTFDCIR